MLCIADVASKGGTTEGYNTHEEAHEMRMERVGKKYFFNIIIFLHNFALTYTTAFYWWRVVDAKKYKKKIFAILARCIFFRYVDVF
jgi:hypothetical protein